MGPFQIDTRSETPQTPPLKSALMTSSPLDLLGSLTLPFGAPARARAAETRTRPEGGGPMTCRCELKRLQGQRDEPSLALRGPPHQQKPTIRRALHAR